MHRATSDSQHVITVSDSSCSGILYPPLHVIAEFTLIDQSFQPFTKYSEFWEYIIPYNGQTFSIYSKETPRDLAVPISSLNSHSIHGVDNTGMVRVWVAEQVLLYIMLHCFADFIQNK